MKKASLCIFILSVLTTLEPSSVVISKNLNAPLTCEDKLRTMEPIIPKTIYDYQLLRDRDMNNFKRNLEPISSVLKDGIDIPFVSIYKDLDFQRPAYAQQWHSSYWRWSYMPVNLANQQHKLFLYSGGLSVWYDLSNELVLPGDLSNSSPINKKAFSTAYPYVVRIIVFDFNITSIKYYKNQICVIGEPLRKGLTVVDIDIKNIPTSQKLIQLVTPDGYELDYSIM
ncbi:hypothetical protein CFOLD11_43080 [Clostridium folliculivorans]|uniref:Uncharacterized protein n=1 Tax=Clostridium folliculivorans TaxID=2886038 RepID=A0A9W6DCZ3_9CLOT|nr:hypothetical protein [Clostridium folliculivorans]GKU27481.1 hypothetical protein CFOLD11_43080 [Clostridium folliculivorans]